MKAAIPGQRFAVFLRGVNLGKRSVKNGDLVRWLTSLGLEMVEPFLASGNVVFTVGADGGKTAREISQHLSDCAGFGVEVVLRDFGELEKLASANPFRLSDRQAKTWTLHVIFLASQPFAATRQKVLALRGDYDDLKFEGRNLYWLCRGPGISQSDLQRKNLLTKCLPMVHTARNIRTIRRMVEKFGG